MAKFVRNQAERYVGGGDLPGWFSLRDDRDSAKVRFLYKSLDDLMGYSTHEVRIGDKTRQVNCIREYSDPVDACPMCNDAVPLRAKFFIMLQNIETNEVQIWERGVQFISILEDALEDLKGDITQHVFKITRRGKARSTSTTYTVKKVGSTPKATYEKVIAKYPLPKIMGGLVLDKSYEDLEYFQDYGEFPEDGQEETPRRRNAGATRRPTRGTNNASRRSAKPPVEDDFDDYDDMEDDFDEQDDFQDEEYQTDPLPKEFDTQDDLDDFDGGVDDFDDEFEEESDDDFEDDDFEEEQPAQRPARGTRGTKPARGTRGTRPARGSSRNNSF